MLKNIKALRQKDKDKTIETKEKDLLVILEVVYEMNLRGIELLPVDLMKSKAKRFTIEGNAIRPPFSSVAAVGENAPSALRKRSPADRLVRWRTSASAPKANSAVVNALRELGCLDGMPETNQLTLF